MLNSVYRLIAPRVFEPVQIAMPADAGLVYVRPTYLSICNADVRYYRGARSAEVLAKKLPMALIHEGIGMVVSDATGTFKAGDNVVMLPNSPCETDPVIAENYLASSKFCGSGFDGFMQELVCLPPARVVKLPDGIDSEIASFTELVSVASHAISRFNISAHERRDVIGVWGDGNLGFIVSLLLKTKFPESRVCVFGRNSYKLNDFTFVDEARLVHEASSFEGVIDHAFECCGGEGSVPAINQIIETVRPEGSISLLGVSENLVPLNTRMVLEKGLRLFGSSRSGRADFLDVIDLYNTHPEVPKYLEALKGAVFEVNSVSDMVSAFEGDLRKSAGKTIMKWDV